MGMAAPYQKAIPLLVIQPLGGRWFPGVVVVPENGVIDHSHSRLAHWIAINVGNKFGIPLISFNIPS